MKSVVRTVSGLKDFAAKVEPLLNGSPYLLTIKPYKPPRSLDQNAKVHAMFGQLASHIGHSPSEVKDFIKAENGPKKLVVIGGKERSVPKSTADYTKSEMSDFIDRVYQIGAEIGCVFYEEE